jgi:lipoate-protein ligase B
VVAHVRRIEAALIEALAAFGITGARVDGRSGVWVGNEKIAAIGVRVARDRTMHGFALNVDPDLAMFGHIVPCGIRDHGVSSVFELTGAAPSVREAAEVALTHLADVLGAAASTLHEPAAAWHASDGNALSVDAP